MLTSSLLVLLWTAHAVQGTVVVLPVEVSEFGGQTNSRRSEVEDVLRSVLGARMKKAPAGTPPCEKDACFKLIADTQGADEVALVSLMKRDGGGFADLTVRVFDAEGQPVLALKETLPQRDLAPTLGEIFTRAFDAPRHAGRIKVEGVEDGEELLIDGLPTGGGGQAELSVGPHVVSARAPDGRTRSVEVTVAYDSVVSAPLPPQQAPSVASGPAPLWPALVAAGTSIAAVAAAGGMVGIGLFDLEEARTARKVAALPSRDAEPVGKADPVDVGVPEESKNKWAEGYGTPVVPNKATNGARLRFRAIMTNQAVANETAATALMGTALVAVAVAVAGGIATWLLWPAETGETE